MSFCAMPYRDSALIFVTDYGTTVLTRQEFNEAGLHWTHRQTYPKKTRLILQDFMTLFDRDRWMAGENF